MRFVNDAKAKVDAFLRGNKERAEERKASRRAAAAQDPHHYGRFWLLNIPATATICAAFVEVYWAILFCIEATGRVDGNFDLALAWNQPLRFLWDFAFSGNAPVLLGLLCATAPIVMISMVWLPVQFAMRGAGRWRRGTLVFAGLLANAIVILSGTVVMNANRQDQVRAGLVVEQQAEQNRAGLQARYNAVEQRWRTLTEPSNTTLQAQAARAGVAGWDSYIATARQQAQQGTITPNRLALIERARGSAVAAEEYVHQMDNLTGQIAAAPTQAAVATNVRDDVGQEFNAFAERVKVYRPPLIAFGCTLIGILGAWWTLAMLERLNPRDVLRSGWADDAHRIEDHSDEAPLTVAPEGMRPPREEVYDAETGERLIKVKGAKEHFRRAGGKKGKAQRIELTPDIPPDETGVTVDGGNRQASVPVEGDGFGERIAPRANGVDGEVQEQRPVIADGVEQEHAEHEDDGREHDQNHGDNQPAHPEPFSLSDDEQDITLEPAADPVEQFPEPNRDAAVTDDAGQEPADPQQQGDADELQGDHGEPQDEPERAPETDPRKLIPAPESVAAE